MPGAVNVAVNKIDKSPGNPEPSWCDSHVKDHLLELSQHSTLGSLLISISKVRKLKHGEAKELARAHTQVRATPQSTFFPCARLTQFPSLQAG